MTVLATTEPSGLPALLARLRAAGWALPATLGVLALSAFVYLWNLTVSGYGNEFYAAAAWAGSQSWSAWFFGSIDPANFITVDKPPLTTMVIGLSVRLFGLSSAAILVPEALMGIASVGILMAAVRRTFGPAASIIAGLVMALTPAAVLMFRYDNPDALLTLLLVAAAWTLLRGLEEGRFRWLVATGLLVGLAFETKLLQGWMVLPAFAVTWALFAPGSIRRRAAGLAVSLATVLLASSWWAIGVSLAPASIRPYIGGSTDGSALDLVLGYNGLGRIFGGQGNGIGGGPGANFSGMPSILRLFNDQMGGQGAWFLPFAAVGAVAAWWDRRGAVRADRTRAAVVLWALWLATHAVVFSFMSGTIHSYYLVIMAPAIGALVGAGVVALWRARERGSTVAGIVLGATVLGSAALAWLILERTPSFAPGLGIAVLVVGALLAAVIAAPPARIGRPVALGAVALALVVLLAGPAAYAADTMATAYHGGAVAAGPSNGEMGGPGGMRGQLGVRPAGGQPPAGLGNGQPPGGLGNGQPPAGFGGQPPANFGGQPPTMGGNGPGPGMPGGPAASDGTTTDGASTDDASFWNRGGMGGNLDTATVDYLVANRGDATWIVAVQSANTAAPIELSTGLPVMAMGGFTGSDPAPTLVQLQAYLASGRLRFVMVGGGMGPGGGSQTASEISAWVVWKCTATPVNASIYDCAGATTDAGS